ncbi:response regulator [Pseudoponticoccus marisrubri]|uniref:Histidine kinase n=1 Tax=Pseudoponticoccus marisrubri TaxID=1685382 RepID=A0A0W7WMH6_9RHOB|nr:response regulator [Pseudoponticoccus marisrubri]KUF11787.1 histidine kinase [Pseudoponticoccus marisrubri]
MTNTTRCCLIVEDAEVDRRMMRRVFSRQYPRMPLLFAHSLAEARHKLATEHVAIIFLDNALPDGRGVDFVAELAGDARFRALPVILVSDWPSPFMYAKARAANVRAIWSKSDFRDGSVRRAVRTHALSA